MILVDGCERLKLLAQAQTIRRPAMVLAPKAGEGREEGSWQVSEWGEMGRHTHHTLYTQSVMYQHPNRRKNKWEQQVVFPAKPAARQQDRQIRKVCRSTEIHTRYRFSRGSSRFGENQETFLLSGSNAFYP